MRLRVGHICILSITICLCHWENVDSFTTVLTRPSFAVNSFSGNRFREAYDVADIALFAKKKKGKVPVAADLDFDAFDDDEPMSKKDQMKAQKQAAKAAKKASAAKEEPVAAFDLDSIDDEPMSKKDQMKAQKKAEKEAKKNAKALEQNQPDEIVPAGKKDRKAAALKALEEMERMEAEMATESNNVEDDQPKLSKKELKALKKKQEKVAAKQAAKEAKKAAKQASNEDASDEMAPNGEVLGENGAPVVSATHFSNFLVSTGGVLELIII